MWCVLELLTRHSQEAQPEAGRKDQLEGNPVGRRGPLVGSPGGRMGLGEGSLAGRMGLEERSFAEAQRIARTGPQQAQARQPVLLR